MAANLQLTNARVNAEVAQLSNDLSNGYLRIYSGAIPATADTALAGNTLLAEPRFNAAGAFDAAVAGVAAYKAIAVVVGLAAGDAAFFRALRSDGTTVEYQDTVGTSGEGLNLSSITIAIGGDVTITGGTFQKRKVKP